MSRYCWKSILPPVGLMLNIHQLDSCVLLSGSNDRWTHFSNMRYCFANLEKELSLCFQSSKIWSHSLDTALSSSFSCAGRGLSQ